MATSPTPLVRNEQIKLTAHFLAKIGGFLVFSGVAVPLLLPVSIGTMLYAAGAILLGLVMLLTGFWYLSKLR